MYWRVTFWLRLANTTVRQLLAVTYTAMLLTWGAMSQMISQGEDVTVGVVNETHGQWGDETIELVAPSMEQSFAASRGEDPVGTFIAEQIMLPVAYITDYVMFVAAEPYAAFFAATGLWRLWPLWLGLAFLPWFWRPEVIRVLRQVLRH